jgi:hypothetical protein
MNRMREIPLHDYAGLQAPDAADLRARVADQRTLADVLRWAAALEPPVAIAEIVTQDEYTHDVVLPLAPGRPLFLAYDTT